MGWFASVRERISSAIGAKSDRKETAPETSLKDGTLDSGKPTPEAASSGESLDRPIVETYVRAHLIEEQERQKEIDRVIAYFQENPIAQLLPRDAYDEADEAKLMAYELELRREYAEFVDALPARARKKMPTFEQLKSYSYPEEEIPAKELRESRRPYIQLLNRISQVIPAAEAPQFAQHEGMGNEDEELTVNQMVLGRLQSFIFAAEDWDEAVRKVDRNSGYHLGK